MSESRSEVKFSFVVTMAFTLNYIIGSGFLTIPWAFAETGCLLGFIIMLALYFLSTASANFLVETLARASYAFEHNLVRVRLEATESDKRILNGKSYQAVDSIKANEIVMNPMTAFELDGSRHELETGPNIIANIDESILVGKHTFEVTELCDKFLGPLGVRVYSVFIALYFYGTLWAYSSVFANSFDAIFGSSIDGESGAYEVFLVIFACIVVPISMLELTEQVYIQVTLSIWRVAMLFIMIGTLAVSWMFHVDAFTNYSAGSHDVLLYKFEPSKIYILLPIATYSFIFHHSIPSLAHPVTDKAQVANIFAASLLVCFVAYLCVGVIVSLYFGDNMKHSSNLCWASYVGDASASNHSWIMKFVAATASKFIVLFPAVDVASAFPLNAITLGNNLQSLSLFQFCGVGKSSRITSSTVGDHVTTNDTSSTSRTRYFYRAFASIPPIIGAFFVKDLGKITNYTGLCGFAIAFVFPPLLAMASEKYMVMHGLPNKTAYGGSWRTGKTVRWITVVAGFVLIGYVLFCNVMGY